MEKDGRFIGKIGKNKGYSSYVISDLDNNIVNIEDRGSEISYGVFHN
jgi:hypothetical protein